MSYAQNLSVLTECLVFSRLAFSHLVVWSIFFTSCYLVCHFHARKHTRMHTCTRTRTHARMHTCTHTHILWPSRLCPGLSGWAGTRTNLNFTEARDSKWQWHQLGHMQICTSPQRDNHVSTSPLSFYRPDALPAAQPTARSKIFTSSIFTSCILCAPIKLQALTGPSRGGHLAVTNKLHSFCQYSKNYQQWFPKISLPFLAGIGRVNLTRILGVSFSCTLSQHSILT